jgi:hypothetical protein
MRLVSRIGIIGFGRIFNRFGEDFKGFWKDFGETWLKHVWLQNLLYD